MTKKQKKDISTLTPAEKKIYDSVMANFPATPHEYALDVTYKGGVNWQFIPT